MKVSEFDCVKLAKCAAASQLEYFNKMMQNKESKLIHRKGNLLDLAEAGEFDVVVHGCNCFNKMGSGIAREICARYPEVARADAETKYGDYGKLGAWSSEYAWFPKRSVCDIDYEGNNYVIINAYTQFKISSGNDVFEYEAFQLILRKLAFVYPNMDFGFPYIGMGLARGNKERIMAMLEDFAEKVSASGGSVTLVEYKANR